LGDAKGPILVELKEKVPPSPIRNQPNKAIIYTEIFMYFTRNFGYKIQGLFLRGYRLYGSQIALSTQNVVVLKLSAKSSLYSI
jgi:hypothetical protein